MIKLKFNDRYIRGTVVFNQVTEDTATLAFQGAGKLPENAQYTIDGKKWRVMSVTPSDFNLGVFNASLQLVGE